MNKVKSYLPIVNSLGLKICDLSDDLLASILFTNYLSHSWLAVWNVLLVCKSFLSLGANRIVYVDYFSRRKRLADVSRLFATTPRLLFLNVPFNILGYSMKELMNSVSGLNSLRGLQLRGTHVSDATLASLNKLEQLRFLDLSKDRSNDSHLITDCGVKSLTCLKSLRWIDLSMTLITDEAICFVCQSNPSLNHLAVSCCSLITDEAATYFQCLKIKTLDISGCHKLSIATIEAIVNPLNAISGSLTRLCMSYLINVRSQDALKLVLQLNYLTEVECRCSHSDSKVPEDSMYLIPQELREVARERFATCILQHSDQVELRGRNYLINPSPKLVQLCPTLAFPYKTEDEL